MQGASRDRHMLSLHHRVHIGVEKNNGVMQDASRDRHSLRSHHRVHIGVEEK